MADESHSSNQLLQLALVAGAGWVAYEYWWKPKQVQDEYNRQVALYQAQHGVSRQDAIAQIGSIACTGAAAYFGGPSTAAMLTNTGLCRVAGTLASGIVHGLPGAAGAVYSGGKTVVTDIYRGGSTVVKDVVSVPKKIVGGIVSGIRSLLPHF